MQQPCVGGDKVARFELQDVAGYEQRGVDDLLLAVAQHACVRSGHAFERIQRLFGLTLLQHSHHCVEYDNQQNQPRLKEFHRVAFGAGDDERNGRRREQDEDHNVLELVEEPPQRRFFLLLAQPVLPVLRQPRGRSFAGQAGIRVRAERVQHGFGAFVVVCQNNASSLC